MAKTFKEFLSEKRLILAIECGCIKSECMQIWVEAHSYDIDELLREYQQEEETNG